MIRPARKSEKVENALTETLGVDRRDSISELRCLPGIGCGSPIDPSEFECYGPATRREFTISGLCGPCQVRIMGGSTHD